VRSKKKYQQNPVNARHSEALISATLACQRQARFHALSYQTCSTVLQYSAELTTRLACCALCARACFVFGDPQ